MIQKELLNDYFIDGDGENRGKDLNTPKPVWIFRWVGNIHEQENNC